MAWQDEMVTMLRELINDSGDTQLFTSDRLEKTLTVAAFQVCRDIQFDTAYTISVSNVSISPDPTEEATKNESFTNLTCIKAAAIIDRGSAILAARRAISVRDGSSAIDLRGPLQGWLKLLEKGWNAVYEEEKLKYELGQSQIAGAAVMSPFRTFESNDGSNYL